MQGTMIWFNPAKRHGFIRTDEGERLRVDEGGLGPGSCSRTGAAAHESGLSVLVRNSTTRVR